MKKPLLVTISVVAMLMFTVSCSAPEETPKVPVNTEDIVENEVEPYFKSADDFAASFDKDGKVSEAVRQESFDLYNKHEWEKLEALFTKDSLNGGWPPANGGFNIIPNVTLKDGQLFDRYSGSFGLSADSLPILGGQFTSPILDGVRYSFTQRALNKPEQDYDYYYTIEVLKDLPFKAQDADVIPWFNQEGLGKQTMWEIPADSTTTSGYPYTWNQLAEMGYIKVTINSSPSGKGDAFVNKVID